MNDLNLLFNDIICFLIEHKYLVLLNKILNIKDNYNTNKYINETILKKDIKIITRLIGKFKAYPIFEKKIEKLKYELDELLESILIMNTLGGDNNEFYEF